MELAGHPKHGASWEGFALEQALSVAGTRQAFFWGTHSGAELDLMLMLGGKRYGVEFKCADAPVMTRSLHIALEDLKLERASIVYPGQENYPVHEKVRVCRWRICWRNSPRGGSPHDTDQSAPGAVSIEPQGQQDLVTAPNVHRWPDLQR